jgi:hypothetical protein
MCMSCHVCVRTRVCVIGWMHEWGSPGGPQAGGVRHTVILPLALTESNLACSPLLCRGLLPDGRFSSEGGAGTAGVLLDLLARLLLGRDEAAGGAPGAAAPGGGGAADRGVCGAAPAA